MTFSFVFYCYKLEEVNYNKLKELAIKEGVVLFGVCNTNKIQKLMHQSIKDIGEKLPFAISIGYKLSDGILSTILDKPNLIYKHHYKTVNWILDQISAKLSNFIEKEGYMALSIPASQIVDWKEQCGHLPHIKVAYECGHGWIGKSGLLVNPKYGARIRFSTILTNMPLKADSPIEGTCGDCNKCIEICPAKAISEKGWDKEKCYNKLKEFHKYLGVYICGVCVKVCKGGLKN